MTYIKIDENIHNGLPCLVGSELTIARIFHKLSENKTIEQIAIEDNVNREDLSCLLLELGVLFSLRNIKE